MWREKCERKKRKQMENKIDRDRSIKEGEMKVMLSPVCPYAKQDAETPFRTLLTISAPMARCTPS